MNSAELAKELLLALHREGHNFFYKDQSFAEGMPASVDVQLMKSKFDGEKYMLISNTINNMTIKVDAEDLFKELGL